MKKNYNLDELEHFLSDSAEQHRMYPSDRVWRNIDQELHGPKRWPALTFGAILTGAVITAGLILVHPDKSLLSSTISLPENLVVPSQQFLAKNNSVISSSKLLPSKKEIPFISGTDNSISVPYYNNNVMPASGTKRYIKESDVTANSGQDYAVEKHSISQQPEKNVQINAGNIPENSLSNVFEGMRETTPVISKKVVLATIGLGNLDLVTTDNNLEVPAPDLKVNESLIKNVGKPSVNSKIRNQKLNTKKWSLLFYATPSISYRYLSEAKIVDLHLQNGPVAPNLTHGVSDFVTHKTITGYELGSAVMYNISPSVRIKAGLQFNSRGYNIEAYAARTEASTILLDRGYYTDSLTAVSSIGAQEGYKSIEISNRYFEISIPLALDMRVANWKKIQLYVAAGIQPTYQFNQSMYLISSDYKKYVQEPDLARHWNMNSSVEAFISYKVAGVTWQAGPQIRYQLLPGATNQYPVRERLIDYGFKIGVVKTLK